MTDLDRALATRDSIVDVMLGLAEYAPMTLKRKALQTFLMTGHQEQAMPINLRRAQARVKELLEE